MGYADKFYYGQNKLIVNAPSGKASVTDGERTWEETISNGKAVFMLPNTRKYTVTVGSNTQDVYLGYGECANITL